MIRETLWIFVLYHYLWTPWNSARVPSSTYRLKTLLRLPLVSASSGKSVLGRYDSLDPCGSDKAIEELKWILQPCGDLSLPLEDMNRICFNAHRAFCEDYLMQLFEPFEVVDRRYIYGREFGASIKPGFGMGCYHLRRLL